MLKVITKYSIILLLVLIFSQISSNNKLFSWDCSRSFGLVGESSITDDYWNSFGYCSHCPYSNENLIRGEYKSLVMSIFVVA